LVVDAEGWDRMPGGRIVVLIRRYAGDDPAASEFELLVAS
jgi:hypothetical protein